MARSMWTDAWKNSFGDTPEARQSSISNMEEHLKLIHEQIWDCHNSVKGRIETVYVTKNLSEAEAILICKVLKQYGHLGCSHTATIAPDEITGRMGWFVTIRIWWGK